MKPVKTETSNVTFVGEGCQDLPGTRYMCDDGVTPGIETVWELDDKVGTCPECGGWLIYIHALNEIVCDTCEYTEEGVD